MKINRVIKISRPRFWIYVLGPYLLGVIAAGDPRLYNFETLIILGVLFFFFTFSANILIYGVNDIYDYETDKHNPKKRGYEELLMPHEQQKLWHIIELAIIPFLLLFLWLDGLSLLFLVLFMFTGIYYSAKPLRAKSRPPLDIIFSSIIYISPAVVGFFATGNNNISWLTVLGGLLWAFAMQTYSAVPDIESDNRAKVPTLATALGKKTSLWFCFISYLAATIIAYYYLGFIALLLGLIYLFMVFYTIRNPEKSFFVYKKFPLINTILGMVLFFSLLFRNILF